MKLFHYATALFIGVNSFAVSAPTASPLETLSTNAADALVQQEMKERKAVELALLEHIRSFGSQRKIVTSDGKRKTTLSRISRPVLPERDVTARPTAYGTPLAVDMAAESKACKLLNLSATVYDEQITEIVMQHEGKKLHVYVNINFHCLQGVGQLETADTVYSVIMTVLPGYWQDSDTALPQIGDFTPGEIEFHFAQDSDPDLGEDAFDALDALCRHYLQNELQLQVAYQRNEALSAARARYLEKNPPQPIETIFNFWKK